MLVSPHCNAMKRTVNISGRELTYELEWKRVKRINMRIHEDGSVHVSASKCVPLEAVDAAVIENGHIILTAVDRYLSLIALDTNRFYLLGRNLQIDVVPGNEDTVEVDGAHLRLRTNDPDKLLSKFRDDKCREVFGEILRELHPKVGVTLPKVRIRDMKTRWGSCSPHTCSITLNKQLLRFPRECIEYVVMHELCHFVHPNHSKEFYELLAMRMPDWKERKEKLRR